MTKFVKFAFDVQLNDNEDWIKEGTIVEVSDNPFHLNRFQNSLPVLIKEAFTFDGDFYRIKYPIVEYFDKKTFHDV